MAPSIQSSSASPSERVGFLTAPIVAMTLIILLLGILLWLLHLREVQTQREAVEKELLWVELTLRSRLGADEERLLQLAASLDGAEPDGAAGRMGQILAANPEITRLAWRDADRRVIAALPPLSGAGAENDAIADPAAYERALSRRVPQYTAPIARPGDALFTAYIPIVRQDQVKGMLTADYSIEALLVHGVPWWFSHKYNLSIVGRAGALFGAKSRIPVDRQGPSAELAFDPPGHGTLLVVNGYRPATNRSRNLVLAAILILALATIWSLWASQRNAKRRLASEQALRQHQEKLQQTARLIAMGEMASTLAHEINQPLAAIAGYCTGCLNQLSSGLCDPEELVPTLGKLGAQAQRAGEVVRRIRDFTRLREPCLAPCAIAEIVRDSVDFIAADARRSNITIDVTIAEPGLTAMADHILIEQVLLNLMRNGIEAMAQVPLKSRRLEIVLGRADGAIGVRIADRGAGIPAEIAGQIYAPFFTTKAEGMGMGLNICRSIMEFHRGRLWHQANEGGGTVFAFTLPIGP